MLENGEGEERSAEACVSVTLAYFLKYISLQSLFSNSTSTE